MSENKSTPPATSCAIPVVSAPVSMIAVSSTGPTTSLTPTSNVTITTTAAMTHPHPPPTPQAMAHPGVPQSPIPQCNIWMMDDQTNLPKTQYNNQRVQVIQQAPGGGYTPYLQHLYNQPQQLLMSAGNITLQPTTMSPSIQVRMWNPHLEHGDQRDQPFNAFSTPMLGLPIHMGKASGLEQKPNPVAMKPMLMPSTSMAATSMSSAARAGSILAPSSIMTANRQVITAGKHCLPNQITPQMLAASKPLLQGQSNYMTSNPNQTLLIGQLGVLSSQPSLIPAHTKAVGDAQRGKPFVMGQTATLQPKSPILPHPQAGGGASGPAVSGTATVLSSSQFKQMSQGTATLVSTPQLITSQAAMLASQAQILNPLHALGPNYQGITWTTPGGIQSPALLATTQNPIFIRGGQQQDMFLQSPPPQPPPAIQPAPAAAQMPKPKQVRPASSVATQTSVSTSLVQTAQASGGVRPQVKHRTKAQANRTAQTPGVAQSQKADAANQTKLMGPPVQQTTASQGSQTKAQPEIRPQPVQKVTASVETQANSPVPAKSPVTLPSKPPQEEEPMDTSSSDPPPPPPPAEKPMEVATQASSTKEDEVKEAPAEEPAPPVSSTVVTTTSVTIPTTTAVATVTATVATDVSKEKQVPQKAIVKPHILTHVIEGYVIQEGPEPFPVNRSSLITDFNSQKQSPQVEKETEEDGVPSQTAEFVSPPAHPPVQEGHPIDLWKEGCKPTIIIKGLGKKREKADSELAKCEFCGKIAARRKFRRSKRFCSTSCAKRYNVGCSKRIAMFAGPLVPGGPTMPVDVEEPVVHKSRKHHMKSRKGWRKSPQARPPSVHTEEGWQNGGESSQKEETTTDSHSGAESSLSPTTPTSHKDMEVDQPDPAPEPQSAPEPAISRNPMKWSVQDVYDFVRALPGCSDYADEFRMQEIDGQALMLLKEDHLMTAMSMKLGPALKICARINTLRDEVNRH